MTALEDRALATATPFRLTDEIYLVGSLERGLTVYSQQVRALNLVWALKNGPGGAAAKKIAIIGAGIAGLTAAAAAVKAFPTAAISLFERRWDLCPLQQGADSRWLHPRIYDWPDEGSRSPSASLPILNWKAGRASDVAHQLLGEFGERVNAKDHFHVFVGVHLQIAAGQRTITWSGTRTKLTGGFFAPAGRAGEVDERFDVIIVATGFGIERVEPKYPILSYWRIDAVAQPILNRTSSRPYVVSGTGDGALIDLCRLSIERFRQDTIVYELFDGKPEDYETVIREWKTAAAAGGRFSEVFKAQDSSKAMQLALKNIGARIRKDTHTLLHARHPDPIRFALDEQRNSFLNKLLLYLLYRSGAVAPTSLPLEEVLQDNEVDPAHVICRYGADTLKHTVAIFSDVAYVQSKLEAMGESAKKSVQQVPTPSWDLGFFKNEESVS
jgi:hypothetical protein